MLELLRHRRDHDERGASAVEYGLLIAGIAGLVVVIVFAFGGAVKTMFGDSCTTIQSAAATTSTC
ncbi:MAG: Flp family type IVb pilin [Marmoricola sp.]